jgi:excisionase family DNA binding protein
MEDEWLCQKQVAAMLGVSRQFLYAHSDDKKSPPNYRIGRRLRYKRTEVLDWIKKQQGNV